MPDPGSMCVLLVGSFGPERRALAERLQASGYAVSVAEDVVAACERLRSEQCVLVVATLDRPQPAALALLRAADRAWPPARVIFRFDRLDGPSQAALRAIRQSAFACLSADSDDPLLASVTMALAEAAGTTGERAAGPPATDQDALASAVTGERTWLWSMERSRALAPLLRRSPEPGALERSALEAALETTGALSAWLLTWVDGEERSTTAHRAAAPVTPGGPAIMFAREVRLAGRALTRLQDDAAVGALVGVPVAGADGIHGALVIAGHRLHDAALDARLLQPIADQIVEAKRLLTLERRAADADERLLGALLTTLALHDPAAADHSQRVGRLAAELALEMGYEPGSPALDQLRRGALLHDLGKIGIDATILRKRGPLDEAEWAQMRRHPEYGHRILHGIPGLTEAAAMVHASHERWDGRGYPAGLAGEAIPVGARVFILADAWDAMTSDRPYRGAMSTASALQEVRINSGTQFDPAVVVAFERMMARWPSAEQESAA